MIIQHQTKEKNKTKVKQEKESQIKFYEIKGGIKYVKNINTRSKARSKQI